MKMRYTLLKKGARASELIEARLIYDDFIMPPRTTELCIDMSQQTIYAGGDEIGFRVIIC